jgi:YVTN family beta-propeller protein
VLDAVGAPIATPTLTFTSGDPSLVNVGDGGTVQAGTATGETDVTVRAGVASLAVHVTVLPIAHPAGVLDGSSSLAGAWAVDVSRAGTAYVSGSWTDVPLARADLPSHVLAPVLPTDGTGIGAIVFDRAGTTAYLAAGRTQNALIALSVADGTTRWSTTLPSGAFSLAVAPDERTIYALTAGGGLYAIDVATHEISATWSVDGWYTNELAIAPDGRRLYVSQYGNQEVVVIDLETRQITGRIHTVGRPRGLVVSLDGAELYVANWDYAEVTVFDLATQQRIAQLPADEAVSDVALTPDGTQLYVTVPAFGVDVIDRVSHATLQRINVRGGAAHVAFDPVGSTAVLTLNGSGLVAFIK